MRSYADTLSGTKPAGGSSAASACFKFVSVMVGLLLIAGAVFMGIEYLPDKGGDSSATGDGVSRDIVYDQPTDPTTDDGAVRNLPTSASATGGAAASGVAGGPPPLNKPFYKLENFTELDQSVMDYQYADALGDTFLFFEAQHSGDLSSNVGGNRIKWRGQQLMSDGQDINRDLTGGMYEAGNRVKITLPTAYTISHLAWICTYYADVLDAQMYEGRSLLYWCKREVKWGADYLLKTHLFRGAERPSTFNSNTDGMVVMVGNKTDFECYHRAEVRPLEPNCGEETRISIVANANKPAGDVAAYAAAAFAASAALLQEDDPQYAVQAMFSAYAMYDFGKKHNATAGTWNEDVKETYGTGHSSQYMLFAAAMITWAHRCENTKLPLCNDNKARTWLAIAEQEWIYTVEKQPMRHAEHMLSNWANPDYDTALILTAVTGNITSPYAQHIREFIQEYSSATGQISATPKGLVRHEDEQWSPLRLAYISAFTALHFASYPGVDAETQLTARCFARGQMGYTLGDNPMEMSYLTGFGTKWPTQVHHRDVACTLKEDLEGTCVDDSKNIKMFFTDRPNPLTLIGSVVGGPNEQDSFNDARDKYKFTEVALDYNTGLFAGLAGMMAVPSDFWATDCAPIIPTYEFGPYPEKNSKDRTSARVRGEDPNEGLDISEEVALEADIPWDPQSDSSNEAAPDTQL